MPDKRVNIVVVKGIIEVHPDTVQVSFSLGESVVWYCQQGEAVIDFSGEVKGSPFLSDKFDVPGNGFVGSGAPVRGKIGTKYKYKVTVTLPGSAPISKDPEVEVLNGG